MSSLYRERTAFLDFPLCGGDAGPPAFSRCPGSRTPSRTRARLHSTTPSPATTSASYLRHLVPLQGRAATGRWVWWSFARRQPARVSALQNGRGGGRRNRREPEPMHVYVLFNGDPTLSRAITPPLGARHEERVESHHPRVRHRRPLMSRSLERLSEPEGTRRRLLRLSERRLRASAPRREARRPPTRGFDRGDHHHARGAPPAGSAPAARR